MMRPIARTTLAASVLLTVAACSQPPAKVDMRGQYVFGRSGVSGGDNSQRNQSYASYTPRKAASTSSQSSYQPYEPPPVYTNTRHVSQETSGNASIQSVGVSDLPPPAKTAAKAPQSPQASKPQPVNLWTSKPREDVAASTLTAEKPSTGFMWPVNSRKVVSNFGPMGSGKANDGINIASAEGEPVWASSDGEVVYVGNELKGYGNMVILKHAGDKTTTYAYLNRATVDKYDRVKQGDIIGYVGSTGNAAKPQLHFAMREGKTAVDPKKYLSTSMAGL